MDIAGEADFCCSLLPHFGATVWIAKLKQNGEISHMLTDNFIERIVLKFFLLLKRNYSCIPLQEYNMRNLRVPV